ncbi:LysR family transcriptional regulator [uncultured Pluralibacter sp.]|uniref:LysR family transcriptional regulator n=1 Tax=uncultured Pluralibacter sp. TaxID=1490864 RepID=UPI0026152AB8|nr:LysR family transcriptional regulator [uncultured Pluralibacter sp.]
MEWSDIRIFLAVVRAGNYADAAKQLRISRPTVGRRINALEEALGQKLFQRTGKGLLITAEGESILAFAEKMDETALALNRKMAIYDEKLEGDLKITCSEWFAGYVIPNVLMEFSYMYSNVRVELLTSARMLDLSRREADIAIRNIQFNKPDIVQRKLMDVEYAVYAKQTYNFTNSTGKDVNLILMNTDFNHFEDVAWIQKILPEANVMHRSNDRVIHAQLCAAGLGLAVLPTAVGQKISQLKVIDLGMSPPSQKLWLGYHKDLRNVPRIKAVVSALINAQANN